jgi:nucleotide-binding universal stress UspA family protein
VQHALSVAEAIQGDVTLLYVIDDRRSKRTEPMEWPANAIVGHAKCKVRRRVLVGSVAETIGRYADDLGADLVTLTAGAHSWWNRLWRRSAAVDIASATDRPVSFARLSGRTTAREFKAILCVVALDGTDDPLVRSSEELARRCDATLVLLHVVPEVSEALIAYGVPGVEDRPLSREVAEHRLRGLSAELSRPHLTATASGSPYRCIENAAREHKSDLVVIGRHGGALSGLNPRSVLARVSSPVISVPVCSHAILGSNASTSFMHCGQMVTPRQ